VFHQEFGIKQFFRYFFVAVVAAALPYIVHIAAIEYPLDNETCPVIVVELVEIDIPENALVKYRFFFHIR
jgi:hypothetical protein